MKIIFKIFKKPRKALLHIIKKARITNLIPDKIYLHLYYFIATKRPLNLKKPKTFNEKLQWLKIYDRKDIYQKIVDKYEVREYVSERIGEQYLIPIHGIYKNFKEIDFEALPSQFVLKPTHTSGDVFICKDKSNINKSKLKLTVEKWLKKNLYYYHREWPYKNVEPRIICEKLMIDESGNDLKDYKIFTFNGKAKMIQVDSNRFTDHIKNIYDTEWNFIPLSIENDNDPKQQTKKPKNLNEMLQLAEKLGEEFPFVRVDFYNINEKVYFGELTLYPGAGYFKYTPSFYEIEKGKWLSLPDGK